MNGLQLTNNNNKWYKDKYILLSVSFNLLESYNVPNLKVSKQVTWLLNIYKTIIHTKYYLWK